MIAIVYFLIIFCFLSCLIYGNKSEIEEVIEEIEIYPSCSLEVKNAKVASECCLYLSKNGTKLSGAALNSRIERLKRLNVII
jgi:hypothetical protein